MHGFVFPNEVEIQWSLLIVLYPFITGLVAGAFVVSSLYHVFNIKALKPVASFSLLMALSFMLVAPLPLLGHLGRPERGVLIFLTPHFTSAMAGFGYIWMFYLILLLTETWLVFRPDITHYARTTGGFKGLIYRTLTLGMTEMSEEDHRFREKMIKVLAAVGIPAAALLHGYVGFLFGAIKANPWWSTPLMPVIFLLSAIVSGIALLIVMYVVVMKLLGRPIDHVCISALGKWLLAFLVIDLTVEGLEILSMAYEAEESWDVVSQLIVQRIPVTYFGVQLLLGSLIPLVVLGAVAAQARREGAASTLIFAAAVLVIIGVFAMRWNVVIGGQMISKSMRGFTSYTPPLGGREGVLAASVLLMLPFYIFSVIVSLVPPWERPAIAEGELSPEPTEAVPAWEAADSRVRSSAWDWERQ